MNGLLAGLRLRAARWLRRGGTSATLDGAEVCSWEALAAVYREQAARGVPEAVHGLELIEQGRWPSSGRPRER